MQHKECLTSIVLEHRTVSVACVSHYQKPNVFGSRIALQAVLKTNRSRRFKIQYIAQKDLRANTIDLNRGEQLSCRGVGFLHFDISHECIKVCFSICDGQRLAIE